MKRVLLLAVAVGLLFFGSSAFGQEQVSMTFSGWDGSSWDGGGTGFYYGSVNGVAVGPHDSSPGYLCDDFKHEIQVPESWQAHAFQVSNLLTNWGTLGGSTMFGGSVGPAGYLEMAILVEATFSNLAGITGVSGATADDVSAVLWCITGGPGSACNSLTAKSSALMAWLQGRNLGSYRASEFANLWLYVPIPGSQTGKLGTAQEMWGNVPVPEGGAALLYLLLAGVSCFGTMFFRSRNQVSRPGIA
jgi:hypothetical protein